MSRSAYVHKLLLSPILHAWLLNHSLEAPSVASFCLNASIFTRKQEPLSTVCLYFFSIRGLCSNNNLFVLIALVFCAFCTQRQPLDQSPTLHWRFPRSFCPGKTLLGGRFNSTQAPQYTAWCTVVLGNMAIGKVMVTSTAAASRSASPPRASSGA